MIKKKEKEKPTKTIKVDLSDPQENCPFYFYQDGTSIGGFDDCTLNYVGDFGSDEVVCNKNCPLLKHKTIIVEVKG